MIGRVLEVLFILFFELARVVRDLKDNLRIKT
jgi:hypothetical protein